MSYKALYRTYRPTNFDEVKGQDHIVTTLKNIVKAQKVSHAYLFSGPRGTGKTSAAKVFAAILNCKDLNDQLHPCNKCDFCVENSKGASLDVIEMDAASNNGVAEIREIREKVKYAPSNAKYKIYIIDEVHMLTKGAFNALLKTLEEPPAHAIFILATTEPNKIPVTILSRTQRFNFRRVDANILEEHLTYVLEKEGITYEKSALKLISKLSNGGMRDALSIADQAAAYTNGAITFEAISQVFGVISTENQIQIINHASNKNLESLLSLVSEFIDGGADITRLTMSLIEIVKDFIVYKKTTQIKLLDTLSIDEVQSLSLTNEAAYFMLDTLVELLTQLSRSEYPRPTFELAMLKIAKSEDGAVKVNVPELNAESKETVVTPKVEEPIITKPLVDDLFSTQELAEVNEVEESIESLIDTNEIENATNVISNDLEVEDEAEQVEQSIVTTQEVDAPETDDLLSLFSTEQSASEASESQRKYSVAEIINVLIQMDQEKHSLIKKAWPSILSYASNPTYNQYATLLDSTSLVSSGENFILVSSKDENVCNSLNEVKEDSTFIEFINVLFGRPLNLFAITKEEFLEVKERYTILTQSNGLPVPKPIPAMKLGAIEKSQVEKDGEDIFGDLFSL